MTIWTTLLWLLLALPLLVWLEGQIHRALQEAIALATGHPDLALMVYTLILFPGVFLHELSHWLMATLLRVRAHRFSVWPQRQRNGMLVMGYVEMERVDPVREALVGAAPLVIGSGVVVLIGVLVFNAGALGAAVAAGSVREVVAALEQATRAADRWLWLYLMFAVSNAMLPSASDRQAWPLLALFIVLVGGAVYLLGLGPDLAVRLAAPLDYALQLLAAAFTLTILIDAPLVIVLWVLRGLAGAVTGRRLE
jgi:hypothetical protein